MAQPGEVGGAPGRPVGEESRTRGRAAGRRDDVVVAALADAKERCRSVDGGSAASCWWAGPASDGAAELPVTSVWKGRGRGHGNSDDVAVEALGC